MIDDYKLEELKGGLTSYVQSITQPDRKAGHNMYKCPLCGSGTHGGRNSNGAFSITKDGKAWKCFSCNQGGDIFTLIGLHEGLTEFRAQAQRAAEISGITLFTEYTEYTQKPKETKKADVMEVTNNTEKYKEYIAACQGAADKTDYFTSRGFSADIVKRFGLGYDASQGVIVIPYDTTGSYYITRSTTGKQFRKPKSDDAGVEPVYNRAALYDASKPCFVCESPIDAISLIVAGGGACGAVALGGTGSQKLIEQVKAKAPTTMLILSFDNDDAGAKATATTAEDLKALNIPFLTAAYSLEAYEGDKKDANDLLRANRAQLEADIKRNIEEIERLANAEKAARLEAHNAQSAAERLKDFTKGVFNGFYIPTGFSELDKELDGGFYPGLYILGAISSLGKTTLLLQIADQIAQGGRDVLYFSLEMAASELMSKSISRHTYKLCQGDKRNAKTARGITTASRYQSYSQTEKQLIKDATDAYSAYASHLYIYEGIGNIGVEQIKQQVIEHIELTGNTPLIFIDYLQILAPYDMRASDKQNTDKAVLELKRLSRDFNTTVIGISSFNRDNYSTEVNMAAFKESGAIEYGSDVLIALQPQGMKPGYTATEQKENAKLVKQCKRNEERSVEAVILKNRNGRTGGKVGFSYYSLFNCFEQDYGFSPVNEGFTELDEDDDLIPFGND